MPGLSSLSKLKPDTIFFIGAIPLCCSITKMIVQSKHNNIFNNMNFSANATYHYIAKNKKKQLHILHTSYITDHKTNKLTPSKLAKETVTGLNLARKSLFRLMPRGFSESLQSNAKVVSYIRLMAASVILRPIHFDPAICFYVT